MNKKQPDAGVLADQSIGLLKELIRIPSQSGNEDRTAALLSGFLDEAGIPSARTFNNIQAGNRFFDPSKPTILMNSHHDTVQAGDGWLTDPYDPAEKDGCLTGLGSNDAGASLVALLAVFRYYYDRGDLNYNLLYLATGEEESSGPNGMRAMVPELGFVDLAIVGEPTGMEMAVAEKGLIVLECTARGKNGHAARDTGDNAIYKALRDISWFKDYTFPRVSGMLGTVKMTVTKVHGGYQHNVIPDVCKFTVDIRSTDVYTHEEIMDTVKEHISSEVTRCSLRLSPSSIDKNHPVVAAARRLGIPVFGSPTLSDQALLPMPSVKIGPGRSERSHTPNEHVYLDEIRQGIHRYIQLLNELLV